MASKLENDRTWLALIWNFFFSYFLASFSCDADDVAKAASW